MTLNRRRSAVWVTAPISVALIGFTIGVASGEGTTAVLAANTGDQTELLSSRDQLKVSTERIRTFRATEALAEIEANIAILKGVKAKVEAASNIDDVIDDVAGALDSMASSYATIAAMKKEIELTYKSEFRLFDDIALKTGNTLAQIRAEKTRCETEAATGLSALPTLTDPTEQRKAEILVRSLKSQAGQWGAKESIWLKFEVAQKKVKSKLAISGKQVDLLIFLLEQNATVYKGAASVARLRKSAKDTLNNFLDFQDLNGAAGDLTETWSELDGIVDRMASDEFVLGTDDREAP